MYPVNIYVHLRDFYRAEDRDVVSLQKWVQNVLYMQCIPITRGGCHLYDCRKLLPSCLYPGQRQCLTPHACSFSLFFHRYLTPALSYSFISLPFLLPQFTVTPVQLVQRSSWRDCAISPASISKFATADASRMVSNDLLDTVRLRSLRSSPEQRKPNSLFTPKYYARRVRCYVCWLMAIGRSEKNERSNCPIGALLRFHPSSNGCTPGIISVSFLSLARPADASRHLETKFGNRTFSP